MTGKYKILKNDVYGRYMVANKKMKQGELILKERPLVLGPQIDGPLICFRCCKAIIKIGYDCCENCNAAVICSKKCTGEYHPSEECRTIREMGLRGNDLINNSQIILPLRCLLLQKYNSASWNTLTKLEPHLQERRNTPIWRRHKFYVERILLQMNYLTENDIKDELVQVICGILDVNAFEVRQPQNNQTHCIRNPEIECLRGIYPEAALMTHDCVGNTFLSIDDNFVMTVHASVDIAENEIIYFNYSNVLFGTIDRRRHLHEGKYFHCSCHRCNDPSELETNMSSLKCPSCRIGYIKPNIDGIDWWCDRCEHNYRNSLIRLAVDEGRRKLQDIDPTKITEMEELFQKLCRTFHPNHFLILELMQNMIGLYAHLPHNIKNLMRKIELCNNLLMVMNKIEPGISRLQGITLYELHSAEVDSAHKKFRNKDIKNDELLEKLLAAEHNLKSALKHLVYEPVNSPEGRMAQNALSELKLLRISIKGIQKSILNGDNSKPSERNKSVKKFISHDKAQSNILEENNLKKSEESHNLSEMRSSTSHKKSKNKKKKH